jgi:hypothetical protein
VLINKEKLEFIEMLTLNNIANANQSGFWLSRVLNFIQALYEIKDFEFDIDLKSLQKYNTHQIQDYLFNLPGYRANNQEQDQIVYMHHGFITMSVTDYAKTLVEKPKQYLKSSGSNETYDFDYQYYVLPFKSLCLPHYKIFLSLKNNKDFYIKVEKFTNFYRILLSINNVKKSFLMPDTYLDNNEYGKNNKTVFFGEILKEIESKSLNLKTINAETVIEIADYIRLMKY